MRQIYFLTFKHKTFVKFEPIKELQIFSAVNDSPSTKLFFHSVPHFYKIHFFVSFRMRNLLASETLIPPSLTNVQELNFGAENAQTVPPYLDVLLHNHIHSVH